MRILIIEDEERLAGIIARVLAQERFAVDIVHDGEAGLDAALTGAYDAIILDRMLPKRDGASIVRTCVALGQIAQGMAEPTGPSLEWDDRDQVLVLPDPYLLFYLRWSGVLERAADD